MCWAGRGGMLGLLGKRWWLRGAAPGVVCAVRRVAMWPPPRRLLTHRVCGLGSPPPRPLAPLPLLLPHTTPTTPTTPPRTHAGQRGVLLLQRRAAREAGGSRARRGGRESAARDRPEEAGGWGGGCVGGVLGGAWGASSRGAAGVAGQGRWLWNSPPACRDELLSCQCTHSTTTPGWVPAFTSRHSRPSSRLSVSRRPYRPPLPLRLPAGVRRGRQLCGD